MNMRYFIVIFLLFFVSETLQANKGSMNRGRSLRSNPQQQRIKPNQQLTTSIPKNPTNSKRPTIDFSQPHNRSLFSNLTGLFTRKNSTQYDDPDLIEAVLEGNLARIKALVDKGANVNIKDERRYISGQRERLPSRTPLMYTADRDNIEVARLLVELEADVNLENQYGWTAFMISIFYGHSDVAKLLADAGANVDVKEKRDNRTILMIVSHRGDIEMVEFLINEFDIDINARDKNNWTAYMLARYAYMLTRSEDYSKVVTFLESLGDDNVEFTKEDNHQILKGTPSLNDN